MMKHEFENLVGKEVTTEDYGIIETVYVNYPGIHHTNGKKQVAELYKVFGLRIFEDMLPRAKRVYELEIQIRTKESQLKDLRRELKEL
jgi:hypothetical protein